ncbi:MAG: ATPase, T2SS/T4P/T4SS family, partial [Candidatus Omnitrophota bacterium]
MVKSFKERLSEILIKNKLLSEGQLKEALSVQRKRGARFSKVLVEMGFIKEKELIELLSAELDIPIIDLAKYKIDKELATLIPKDVAVQQGVIAVSKIKDTLTIAMLDPLDVFTIDDIRSLTGFNITPLITTSASLVQAISAVYGVEESEIGSLTKEIEQTHAELVSEPIPEDKLDTSELARLVEETPVVKITDAILSEAVKLRASDILIEPMENTLRVRYRIDGVLQEKDAPPKSMHPALVSRIKVLSALDIAERRKPQDGRFKLKIQDKEIDFRISVLPSSFGEKVAVRVLDKTELTLDIEKLGFEKGSLSDLKKCAQRPYGMVLICGPTGCGKTTTLYSVLEFIDSPQKNVITVEDPVEYQLDGINQVSEHPDVGLTFARALRSILRQDPNIIMIGEIRDLETCDIAIKAALTGHLVLSTLHTATAAGSIVRLVNMGIEPFLITS